LRLAVMANRTQKGFLTQHGKDPQYLITRIVKQKIWDSRFWKEVCFALTAETAVDVAAKLQYIGFTYGGTRKPTPFMCVMQKLLQIQPDPTVVKLYLDQKEYKYLRAVGALYWRIVGFPAKDVYGFLEPLYADYRKLRYRDIDGSFKIIRMDEWVDDLLKKPTMMDVGLMQLTKREVLEENSILKPYESPLADELDALEEDYEAERKAEQEKKEREEREAAREAAEAERRAEDDARRAEIAARRQAREEEAAMSDNSAVEKPQYKNGADKGKAEQPRRRSRSRSARRPSRGRRDLDAPRQDEDRGDRRRDRSRSRRRSRSRSRRGRDRDRDRDHRDRDDGRRGGDRGDRDRDRKEDGRREEPRRDKDRKEEPRRDRKEDGRKEEPRKERKEGGREEEPKKERKDDTRKEESRRDRDRKDDGRREDRGRDRDRDRDRDDRRKEDAKKHDKEKERRPREEERTTKEAAKPEIKEEPTPINPDLPVVKEEKIDVDELAQGKKDKKEKEKKEKKAKFPKGLFKDSTKPQKTAHEAAGGGGEVDFWNSERAKLGLAPLK